MENRMTVCERFLNGWRSSQIIQRTQKCLHRHTFFRTQIRNVPRKWWRDQDNSHKSGCYARKACQRLLEIELCQIRGQDLRVQGVREPTLRRDQLERREDLREDFQGNSEKSQPLDIRTDDSEVRADFSSIEGNYIYHHHTKPRVQLYVPKEETFPVPLKYIDVTRSTHTDLDVMQEKRIDERKVDANRNLSDSWRGFTKFTLLKEEPPRGYMWSTERLTKDSNDYGTRSCMARSLDENWECRSESR